jgi:hypothetical protein
LQAPSEEGQLIAATSEGFQPPQCKTSVDEVPFLTTEHRIEPGLLQLHYSAKELKDLYGWDKAPKIAVQNGSHEYNSYNTTIREVGRAFVEGCLLIIVVGHGAYFQHKLQF